MKITLTSAECQEILCEAVKMKFEDAFREMAGIVTYDQKCFSTFVVKMDGRVCGSADGILAPSIDIDFVADDILISTGPEKA